MLKKSKIPNREFTITELKNIFGVCRNTVYNWIERGDLKARKVDTKNGTTKYGVEYRVLASDLAKFLDNKGAKYLK